MKTNISVYNKMTSYGNIHKKFLQAFMNVGYIKANLAPSILQNIANSEGNNNINAGDIDTLIAIINDQIGLFDYKIKKINFDLTGDSYFVYMNVTESGIDKFQVEYKESDLLYFRLIIHNMIVSRKFHISQMEIVNLCSQVPVKPIPKTHGEILMNKWIKAGYFFEDDHQFYFGPKFTSEFSSYVSAYFPNMVKKCFLCKEHLFLNNHCASCNAGIHRTCLKKYSTRFTTCPSCKKEWELSTSSQFIN